MNVTYKDLKDGYVFNPADHMRIGELDCIIKGNRGNWWISLDDIPEIEIYNKLGISVENKIAIARSCKATNTSYPSPEFGTLEDLSMFVKEILMYKKENEKPSEIKRHDNPTYFDLKGGAILEKGDILNIHGIKYQVTDGGSSGCCCWLTVFGGMRNSIIFDKLGIKDKFAFVKGICPIVNSGDFPVVGSYEDLTKVVIALYEVPEFKVGDKVKVAHRKDDEDDYPYSFTDDMTKLEGKEFTVKYCDITNCNIHAGKANERLNEDPYAYQLKSGEGYTWHSSMLEKVSESDEKSTVSYDDLKSGHILKEGEDVVIHGIRHTVHSCCFLVPHDYSDYGIIFSRLGIKDKDSFARKFGQLRRSGCGFPEMASFEDLTKLVIGLFEVSEVKQLKPVKSETIYISMDISEPDELSDTGTVRLPVIKDDFKIIL